MVEIYNRKTQKQEVLNSVADKILQNQTGKQEVFLDPASIMLTISIITKIVELFKYCNKTPEEAIKVSYRLKTSWEKRQLKRTIRKEVGWWNWTQRKQLYNAILNTQNVNLGEINVLYRI